MAAAASVVVVGGLAIAGPAWAADEDIRINEVQSSSETDAPDFVELTNAGAEAVDVSGWILRDDDDAHAAVVPDGTVLEPGAFLVIEPDSGDDGFGLGKNDEARLFAPDGETLVDEYAWTDHAASEGRIPDGTGDFVDTEPTPGEPNAVREEEDDEGDGETAETPVVLNEIETNGDPIGDWIELANTDQESSADVSGWTIVDGDPSHDPIVLPEGTEIESGGYLGVLTEPDFGLGGEDSVTIADADGAIVATHEWSEHSPTTIARCPDMTGEFADSAGGTFELPNTCGDVEQPDVDVEPWPFGDEVRDAVAPGTWGDDMSGMDIAPDGTIYAVNNDNGEIFRLAGGPETYTVDRSWEPTYPDGTGTPDGEGITVGDDGAVYLATERNNDASDVSRPSILRVELGETGATTTNEWNLKDITGELGANGGAEAVEWISDEDATAAGLADVDGRAYDPAAYGEHFGGVFAAGIEQTGRIHVVVLEADGGITELQTIGNSEAVPNVMGLDWRAGGNELWALCDEVCDNRSAVFEIADGAFERRAEYAAPTGMNPAYTNEGLAMAWCASDPQADPSVFWMSDSAHEGVSLRVADGADCDGEGGGSGDGGDDGAGDDGSGEGPGSGEAPVPTPDDELDGADRGGVSVPASAARGETIEVGVPSLAGEIASVWLHSDPQRLVTGTVGDDGTIRAEIPEDAALGDHRIVVQDGEGTLVGWAPIEIVAAGEAVASGEDGELAVTGSELAPWVPAAALVLLAAGAVLALRRPARG
ncbi:MAG: lamin tail domain-containing protein [Microbacterium sp.]